MAATTYNSQELAILSALTLNRGELTPAALERLFERLRRLRSSK
jgi:hypothetical protein